MRVFSLWLLLSCWAWGQPITLQQATQRAQASNPDILAAERNVSVVRTGLVIAGGRPNPRLTFEQPMTGFSQTKSSVRFELPLEVGGKRSARLVVAQDQLEQADQQVQLLRWQTRIQAEQAYFEASSAQLNLDQLQQGVDLASRLIEVTQKRFKDGDVPQADVIRAQFEEGLARQRLLPARNRRQQALIRLSALWGQPDAKDLELAPVARPSLRQSLAELEDLAVEKRLEMGLAWQERRLNEDRAALAEANLSPAFGVSTSYFHDNHGLSPTWQVGLFVELPWGYDRSGEVDQARAEVAAVEARMQALRVRIVQEVASAYADYEAARLALQRDEQELGPAATRVLGLAQKIYQLGKGDLTQVLVAQKSVLSLQEASVADLALLYATSVNLEKAVGVAIFED